MWGSPGPLPSLLWCEAHLDLLL